MVRATAFPPTEVFMLSGLRNIARSIFFKIFLALLVLSFAVWGIGDIFTGGAGDRVAEVGDLEVTGAELDQDFRRSLQQLQQQTREPLTRADAIRMGLLEQSLQRLVARRIIDAEARSLGITASDETVARVITEQPEFQVDGAFNRQRFDAILRQNGLNEAVFAESIRAERTRESLAGSIRPVGGPPEALAEPLTARLGETRSGELLLAPAARYADVAPADDAELEAFLADRAADFQAPERRDVTAVLLDAQLLVDEITVDEDELRARYEAALQSYSVPERRRVRQLRGDDEAALRAAYDALQGGADPATVVDEDVALSALGEVTEANLPGAFATPIFSAGGVGSITPPIESALGWHVFIVDEIMPAEVEPFEAVRDEIRTEVAREQAAEQLPDLAVALDDALGGGSTLEEAASDLDLPLVQVAGLDRQGLTPTGEPVTALTGWETVLVEAFDAPAGEASLLEQTPDGRYFVVRVDEVTEPRPLTLDEARADVLAIWRAEQALERAEAAAGEALAELQGGMAVDQVMAAHGLERQPVAPRARSARPLDPAVHEALFAATPGTTAEEVVATADGAAERAS